MRGHEAPKRYSHAAVVMRPAVENVASCPVGDTQQRIIRGSLDIVPVSRPLREPVEQIAGNDIGTPRTNSGGDGLDSWCPSRIVGSGWRVDFDVFRKICEQDLACRK